MKVRIVIFCRAAECVLCKCSLLTELSRLCIYEM